MTPRAARCLGTLTRHPSRQVRKRWCGRRPLGARGFGGRTVRGIELDAVPDRGGDGPRAQDPGELVRILDGTVLGAELENGAGLLGSDARQLEELGGAGGVD